MVRLIIFSLTFLFALNFLTFLFKVSTAKFPSPAYFEVFFWPVLIIPIGYAINSLIESLTNSNFLKGRAALLILVVSVSISTFLTLDNEAYDLNNLPEEVDDNMRFSVLDNSDAQNPDFFFQPLIFLESFNSPAFSR